jgi:type II secretory pathway component PulF
MKQVLTAIPVWFARRELHDRRADFYYDLASTLKDRVPLFTTLRKMESRAQQRTPMTAPMYLQMLKGLESGSLSEALRGIASTTELTMIDATQAAGDATMADGLLFLSETVHKTDAMVATMRKAVTYPVVLLLMFASLLTGFSVNAVPILTQLSPASNWPPMGQALYAVSQFITHHGIWLGLGVVAFFVGLFYSFPRWTGRVRKSLDKFLPFNLYRDYASSMLMISLASLMRSGISLRSSLERTYKHSSPWGKWHIRQILINLSKPSNGTFGQAFNTGLFDQELEDRIQDASERSNPIEAFIHIGVGSIDRMILRIEKRAKQLNNSLMVICGVLLAAMMLAFFSTTMSLQSGIRNPNVGAMIK